MSGFSRFNPWCNFGSDGKFDLSQNSFSKEMEFKNLLLDGSLGVKVSDKNLYVLCGNATTGYANIDYILSKIDKWCDIRDSEHPNGWVLMTNGDGYYGHPSIETIATHIANKGVPVIFIQSHFGYCEPDSDYWPKYASAGYFGKGVLHPKMVEDKPKLDSDGNPILVECWGGYQRDIDGNKIGISFPDNALNNSFEGFLINNLGGFLIVGGGKITIEQMEIFKFGSHNKDHFIIAFDKDKISSPANKVYLYVLRNHNIKVCWNTWRANLVEYF